MSHEQLLSDTRMKITADVEDKRYFVLLDGYLVSLPLARFTALLELVLCRLTRSKGYAGVRDFDVSGNIQNLYQNISRTRSDFDNAIGASAGTTLIQNIGSSTYRLALERGEIEISPDLMELAPDHISETLARALLDAVSKCQQQAKVLALVAD